MITLAHISDIHLAPLPPVQADDLLNKRITGFLNWKMKRAEDARRRGPQHPRPPHARAEPRFHRGHRRPHEPGLDAEINTAFNWLQTVGPIRAGLRLAGQPRRLCPRPLEKALERWDGYVLGETVDENQFPFVRRVGDVAIIVCYSAVPTLPWMAFGRFEQQPGGAARALPEAARRRRLLPRRADPSPAQSGGGPPALRPLRRASTSARVVARGRGRADPSRPHATSPRSTPSPARADDVPVVGVAAAGAAQGDTGGHDPARYNLFRIERVGSSW